MNKSVVANPGSVLESLLDGVAKVVANQNP